MEAKASKYWNPKYETAGRDEIRALQLRKLKGLVNWAYTNSPLWQEKFDGAGLKPEDIKSLQDITLIPYLTRDELAQTQTANPPYGKILCVSPEKAIRYHQTSGSSGKAPLRILDGWKDWEWVSEMWCYGMYAFGVRPDDVVYLAYGYGNFIGFWGAHYAAEKIGALTIPSGGLTSEDRIKKIIELGVTVLVCTPTYAIRLAQVAAEMGIDLKSQSKVRLLIHAGEPGANVPSTKKMLSQLWGAKVGDFPGMSETGGSTSYECEAQSGGIHIIEDHYIQEVIDCDGRPLGYGEKGELILTCFGRATLPMIRYRTGDLVERVPHTTCSCGRTFDLYRGGILGRADDMKIIRGTNVFPSAVENIVRKFADIVEFQIILFKLQGIDQVKVQVELKDSPEINNQQEIIQGLGQALYDANKLKFIIEVMSAGMLPKFELKAKRLQDLRYQ